MLNWTRTAAAGVVLSALGLMGACVSGDLSAQTTAPPSTPVLTERSFDAANGMKVAVRMVGPYGASTDLQIICVFRHNPNPPGDKYIEAMRDFDDKLAGLLSSVRDRGEFVGDLGETFYFTTWPGSITPRRVLVIGLGPEKDLSLDTLRVVGRVAAREAVRLKAARVAFSPTIRDQGNTVLEVGDGDRAVVEEVILAYDTEKRLQAQGINERFDINEWVIEAGPSFVDSAISKVGEGVVRASAAAAARSGEPYRRTGR